MKHKSMLIRLTAAEFLVTFLVSMAAIEAYGCNPVFIWGVVISIIWYIIFFVANGVIN